MYVGIDVGGTNLKYGVVDSGGNVLVQGIQKTNLDKENLLNQLVMIVEKYQKRYPAINGIGISMPGIVRKDGFMVTAGAIKSLYNFPLKDEIERRTGLLTVIENDANSVAIAEKWVGAATKVENYLCLVLGTGVGGGIIINNEVYRGAHGMSGEFGWMVIHDSMQESDIERNSLNQRAAVVGGLIHRYNQAAELKQRKQIFDAREIFDLETTHDELAKEVVARFYEDLAVGLLNIISCFDPEMILLGGGISANPEFLTRIKQNLMNLIERHPSIYYLKDKNVLPIIKPTQLRNNAGMIGAVFQVHKAFSDRCVKC